MVKKTRWFEVKYMGIRGSLVRTRILTDIPLNLTLFNLIQLISSHLLNSDYAKPNQTHKLYSTLLNSFQLNSRFNAIRCSEKDQKYCNSSVLSIRII